MRSLLGDNKDLASKDALELLRERQKNFGGPTQRVAVYQNQALDSAQLGHLVFLIIGPGRTLEQAPDRAPDGGYGPGWKYLHVGFLDLDNNALEIEHG